MMGDERKRMLPLIFSEIRADHVDGKLLVTFEVLRIWSRTSKPFWREQV